MLSITLRQSRRRALINEHADEDRPRQSQLVRLGSKATFHSDPTVIALGDDRHAVKARRPLSRSLVPDCLCEPLFAGER
jgi:hypothetical protein